MVLAQLSDYRTEAKCSADQSDVLSTRTWWSCLPNRQPAGNDVGRWRSLPENDGAPPYIFAAGAILNLDAHLAPHLKQALAGDLSPKQAIEAGLAEFIRKEGSIGVVLNALGVASVAGCSAVSAGACAVLAIGAAASANQLYGDVQQVITGKEAKSALVQALMASGLSESDASRYQDYVDSGVLVISVAVVGGQQVYRIASRGNIPGLGQVKNVEFNPSTGQVTGPVPNRHVTDFIDGVTVVDRKTGTTFTGTVDLRPTLHRIESGDSFPHTRDGSIFQNRPVPGKIQPELPVQPEGYYTEYVHPTPGVSGPGPQRIVTGAGGEIYYTPDHYSTFIRLDQ